MNNKKPLLILPFLALVFGFEFPNVSGGFLGFTSSYF